MNDDLNHQLDIYIQAVLGKKAEAVVVLDVGGLTSIADTFIICSGRSNRQVSAIADHVERFLKQQGIRPLSVEGRKEGLWVLMDYGDVIIHVFYEETRSFYDLEGLWVDAKRIITKSLENYKQPTAAPFEGEEIIVE
ncbi:MAG: ribosome silencing factor [Desulfobacteraceae bacterium]|jgi:ribosome-associated protein